MGNSVTFESWNLQDLGTFEILTCTSTLVNNNTVGKKQTVLQYKKTCPINVCQVLHILVHKKGQSTGSGSSLWATAQVLVRLRIIAIDWVQYFWPHKLAAHDLFSCYGLQRMIWCHTMDPDAWSGSALWTKAHDLVPQYWPSRMIWFHIMGHGAWPSSKLWTTAHDLVRHYGPRRMLGSTLRTTAHDLVPLYEPRRMIWFHTMNYGAWSGSTLWITAHDLVPTPHTIDHGAWNGSILRIIAHDLVLHGPPRWSGSTLWTMAHDLVLHMDHGALYSYTLRKTAHVWFHAVDHGVWYCTMLWATAHELVPLYGLRKIWSHAMDHGAWLTVFQGAWPDSTPWATASNKLQIRISRGIEAELVAPSG
jgi:hypothetical protein